MKERWVKFAESSSAAERKKKKEEKEEEEKKKKAAAAAAAAKADGSRPVPTSFAVIASAGPIEEEPEDEADPVISAAALTDALQDCLGVPVTIVLSKADIAVSSVPPTTPVAAAAAASGSASLAERLAHADDDDDAEGEEGKKSKIEDVVTMANVLSFVRAAALRIGASVVFASGKTQKNVDALLATLSSVLFGSAAPLPRHQVYEYGTAFVPAGWDSVKKLSLDVSDQDKLNRDLRAVAAKAQTQAADVSASSAKQETCMGDEDFLQRFVILIHSCCV